MSFFDRLSCFGAGSHCPLTRTRQTGERRYPDGGCQSNRSYSDAWYLPWTSGHLRGFRRDDEYAKKMMHGKQSDVKFDAKCPLFTNCPEWAPVARYHSLAAEADTIPAVLKPTALTSDGEIMAVKHREKAIYGVQFHPESMMTPNGKQMLENFLKEI